MRRRSISGLFVLVAALLVTVSLWAASIDEVKERAKQGDATSQLNLGMMYSRGLGVSEDKTLGLAWLRLAAKQGNAEAKAELDRINAQKARDDADNMYLDALNRLVPDWRTTVTDPKYREFLGTPIEPSSGKTYYNNATECLSALDAVCMASIYNTFKERQKEGSEALEALRKRAEQGDVQAQSKLGLMYANGDGVTANTVEATRWYRMAAEQGNVEAQFVLGWIYSNGKGLPVNDAEAAKWYGRAAERGNAYAQSRLGSMFLEGRGVSQDSAEAARWYRKAAEQGNANAQIVLGLLCDGGKGVSQDFVEAMKWFRMAADQGEAYAQYQIGALYFNGKGVPKDDAQAVEWYRKAALQGNVDAQLSLGFLCLSTENVAGDNYEAAQWFLKAAEQGNPTAQSMFGTMCWSGNGVPKNDAEAVSWLRKAAEQGDEQGKRVLSSIPANSVIDSNSTSGAVGYGTLEFSTSPPDTIFSVFSAYRFVYAGYAPFRAKGLPEGKYEVCFERSGHAIFWRTITVGRQTPVVSATLRQAGLNMKGSGCFDANTQVMRDDFRVAAERVMEAKEKVDKTPLQVTTAEKRRSTGRSVSTRHGNFEIEEKYVETNSNQEEINEYIKELADAIAAYKEIEASLKKVESEGILADPGIRTAWVKAATSHQVESQQH